MSRPGVNAAVTQDGAKYNKLKRPDDYLASMMPSAQPPAKPPAQPPANKTPGKPPGNINDKWQHDLYHPNDIQGKTTTEASKRTHDEADLSDDAAGKVTHKRSRAERFPETRMKFSNKKINRAKDESHGMRSMFPGILDSADVYDENYEDTMEALAYLNSVRSEAQSLPTLLVAPRPADPDDRDSSMDDDGEGDYNAEFIDGTWIARDPIPDEPSYDGAPEITEGLVAQEQYYRKLLWRYQDMRKTLNEKPTVTSTTQATPDSSKIMATDLPFGRHEWLYILDREYPTPSLVRRMNCHDVFAALKYCMKSLDRFQYISKQKSCWIWALLARAPEQGTLDYVGVGFIRDLGHKAGVLGMKLRNEAQRIAQSKYEDYEEEEEEEEEVEDWIVDEDAEPCGDEETSELQQRKGETSAPQESKAVAASQSILNPNDASDAQSDAEMSMSEEEGEVREDDKPTALEQARARLVAQLGDRLVQELVEDGSREPERKAGPNSEVPRSMVGNGQVSSLEEARARVLSRFNDSDPSTNVTRPSKVFSSREEAEHFREQRLYESSGGAKESPESEHKYTPPTETLMTTVAATVSNQPPPSDANEHVEDLDLNTTVTIDMILTVVAECYGQKDLLRLRDVWA